MKKRYLLVFVLALAALMCLQGAALAQEYSWTEDNGHLAFGTPESANPGQCVLRYDGTEKYLLIPGSVNGIPVTQIGSSNRNFAGILSGASGSSVEAIRLGEGVQTIARYAFKGGVNLRYVEIPDTVVNIETNAFAGCTNLKEVTIPPSVQYFGELCLSTADSTFDVQIPMIHVWPGSAAEAYCMKMGYIYDYAPEAGAAGAKYHVGHTFDVIDSSCVITALPGGVTLTAPKETTMWDGVDLLIENLLPGEDFSLHLKMEGIYKDYGSYYHQLIHVKRENGLFTVQTDKEQAYRSGNTEYKNKPYFTWANAYTDDQGRLRIHLALKTNYSDWITSQPLVYHLIWGDGDGAVDCGEMSFTLLPDGFSFANRDSFKGGWRFVSASDGKTYDDMYVTPYDITYRRHDENGEIYYAPRQVTAFSNGELKGPFFSYQVIQRKDAYVFKNEQGVCLTYEKTGESQADYKIAYANSGTPVSTMLYGIEWQDYDTEFNSPSSVAYTLYYEDSLFHQYAGSSKSTCGVQYDGNRVRVYDLATGVFTGQYDFENSGTTGNVYLYQYPVRNGVREGQKSVKYWYAGSERLLLPRPTVSPVPTAGPSTPSPAPLDQALWRREWSNAPSVQAYSDNKNSLNGGFQSARAVDTYGNDNTVGYNVITTLTFHRSNAMFCMTNKQAYPVRYRIFLYNNLSRDEYFITFYAGNHSQLAKLPIPDNNKAFKAVYTKQVQPGEKLYFNIAPKNQKYSKTYDAMIVWDAFDPATMEDEFKIEVLGEETQTVAPYVPAELAPTPFVPVPTAAPTAVPTPTPTAIPTAAPTAVPTPIPTATPVPDTSFFAIKPMDAPFYVEDLIIDGGTAPFDLKQTKMVTDVETDPDAIEQSMQFEAAALYDDGARALLTSSRGVYLAARNGDKAEIQAMLKIRRDDSGWIIGEGNAIKAKTKEINAAIPCGDDLLVVMETTTFETAGNYINGDGARRIGGSSSYSIFLVDWDDLCFYAVMGKDEVYPVPGGRYYVAVGDAAVVIFDLTEGTARQVTLPAAVKGSVTIRRMSAQGGVLYENRKPLGYLSLADGRIYGVDLPEDTWFTGDDYYIQNESDALVVHQANGDMENLLLKADFPYFNKKGFLWGSANNLMWIYGKDFTSDYTTYLLPDRWADGYSAVSGYGMSSPNRLYTIYNYSTTIITMNIARIGTGEFQQASYLRSNITRDSAQYNYITETDYGHVISPVSMDPVDKKTDYDMLSRYGYENYFYDEDRVETVKVFIAGAPDPAKIQSGAAQPSEPAATAEAPAAPPTQAPTPQPVITQAPTPQPVITAAPAIPSDARSIRISGLKDGVGLSATLYSNGTALVTQILPEGEDEQEASWSLDGDTLMLRGRSLYGIAVDLHFSNGAATLYLDGTPITLTFPNDGEAFLLDVCGSAPQGFFTAPPATPVPTAEPTPVPTATPTPVPSTPTPKPITSAIRGKPGYLQIQVKSANATSYIVGKDPYAYTPFRMIDGDEKTAFQFSIKTTKLGKAYLYFEFERPVTIDELWIKNGFWKITNGLDQYTRNSRVKKMTIDFRYDGSTKYKDSKTVTLKDDKNRKDWQTVNLGGKKKVTGVRILIQQIYKGTKFPNDVCISEIMFVQKSK